MKFETKKQAALVWTIAFVFFSGLTSLAVAVGAQFGFVMVALLVFLQIQLLNLSSGQQALVTKANQNFGAVEHHIRTLGQAVMINASRIDGVISALTRSSNPASRNPTINETLH